MSPDATTSTGRADSSFVLHGARKVDAAGVVDEFWMTVEDGMIVGTGTGTGAHPLGAERIIDARGATLTPGFIDLHVHGGGGASFERGAADIRTALGVHRSRGTTRSAVSLVSAPISQLEVSLDVIASLAATDPLIVGAHLEGPFLADSRRGAHDRRALARPDPATVNRLLYASRGALRFITIAPELPGALDAVERFSEAGVVVALGHTECDARTARAAFDRGVRLLTHAFNAMPGIHHRGPGPIAAAFEDDRITLELIMDGEHVDPEIVRLAFGAAVGRIAFVSDAMAAAAAPDGRFVLGGLEVEVVRGRATLVGTETMAGSTLTLDRAYRLGVAAGLDERVVVEALTATPARVLGRDDLGLLARGFRADAVLFDDRLHVRAVWAEGRRVVSEPPA